MTDEQPVGAGPKITANLDELRAGESQLHGLAEETTAKLAGSDQTLASSSPAWRGLKSAAAYAAYAEFETARGKTAATALAKAGEDVGHAVAHYAHTDTTSADTINRIVDGQEPERQ